LGFLALDKAVLRSVKKLHAHRKPFVALADDDPTFFHGIDRRLISQFDEKHIGVPIVSDDHCWSGFDFFARRLFLSP